MIQWNASAKGEIVMHVEIAPEKLQELGKNTKVLERKMIDSLSSEAGYYRKTDYKEHFTLQVPIEMDGAFKNAIVHTGYDPYNIYGNGCNYNVYDKDAILSQLICGYGHEDQYAIRISANVKNGDLNTLNSFGLGILDISGEKPVEVFSFVAQPKDDRENFKAIARIAIEQYYKQVGKNFPQVQLPDGSKHTLTNKSGIQIVYKEDFRGAEGYPYTENRAIQYYGAKTGEVIQTYGYEEGNSGACHSFLTADEASALIADKIQKLEEHEKLVKVNIITDERKKQQEYAE